MQQRWEELKKNTEKLSKKYEKLNTILEQKQFAKTKREQNPTSEEMVGDSSSSTRYRRRKETINILEYIHGGSNGAIFGAWDFLTNSLKYEQLKDLLKLKKGKFIEKLQGKFTGAYARSDTALKKAPATKYSSYHFFFLRFPG